MSPSSAGFVGAGFYHTLPPTAVVTAIPRIITAFDSATRAVDLLRYVVSHEMRPSSVVTKPVDAAALERLTAAILDDRILILELQERPRLPRTSVVSAEMQFSLRPHGSRKQPVEVPFEATALFPRRVVTSTRALVGAVSEIVEILGAPYACVHAGRDEQMVKDEARGLAGVLFYAKPSPEERERVERLDHVQINRGVLGSERIRGAYWGTFLGAHFVDRLGGLDRMRANAPVERVEVLSSGTAYLQLTDEVWDYDRRNFAKKLASLERYLEPISLASIERIPGPPRGPKWGVRPI